MTSIRLPSSDGGETMTDHELELLELQLIATKSSHHYLTAPNNLFPTYPRKHRGTSSLMTLWANRYLLDEGPNETTKKLLKGINTRWDFNAFSLDRLSGGENLATLCTYLFKDLGLINYFKLDAVIIWKFFASVERHYHATNPYHNGVHAADVTQAMSCFIQESFFKDYLKPIEKMAAIIAAVGHDLDHPGLNEKYLIATSSHLAGLYNNSSVLENHHWRTCVALMHESGLAKSLSGTERKECEDLIQKMILATDISRQSDFLRQLAHYLDQNVLEMSQSIYRHFMLQIALKCADISNPCRNWNISRLWSIRACEEFYRQGDRERELDLPVTPFCDRSNISVAKVQSSFYRYVAAPLFEEWHRCLNTSLSTNMINNLTSNQARWDLIIQQETRTTMAESVVSTSSSSGGGGSLQCESRRDSLEPPPHLPRFSRSSGDGDGGEDSDPCSPYPYMPLDSHEDGALTSPRRHSLPPFLSDPLFKLYTSMTSSDELPVMFHRQMSLAAAESKRRSSAVHELRRQNAELLTNLKVAQKRRFFAHRNKTSSTDSSNEASDTALDQQAPKVTFHLGGGGKSSGDAGVVDSRFNTTSATTTTHDIVINHHHHHHHSNNLHQVTTKRRGSAPCTLLLNQIQKIASSAAKAATTASREHSPRGSCSFRNCRRGSLPSDLVSLGHSRSHSRSSSGGPSSRPAHAHEKVASKKKKLLRRRSAGSGDVSLLVNEFVKKKNPALGKRGSLKSSSFGGVGCSSSVILQRPLRTKKTKVDASEVMYNGRLSWHGNSGGKELVTSSSSSTTTVVNGKVCSLINKYLSPSVESELLEELQTPNDSNGRRGSLPAELILC